MGSWHSWVGSRVHGKCKCQMILTVRVMGLWLKACSKQTNLGTAGLVTVPAVQVWLLFFCHSDTTVTFCGYFSKPCPQKQSLSVPIQQCEPLSYILPRLQCGTSLRQSVKQGKQRERDCKQSGLQHHTGFSSFPLRLHLGALGQLKRCCLETGKGRKFHIIPQFSGWKNFKTSEKLVFLSFHERSGTTSWNTCISMSYLIMPRIFRKEQKELFLIQCWISWSHLPVSQLYSLFPLW